MTQTESKSSLESFIDSLLQTAGQLMLIVDHMSRYPSDSSKRSFDEVLSELLAGVLEPAYRKRDPRDFASAAALLAEVRSAIADEVVLVDPGYDANELNGSD